MIISMPERSKVAQVTDWAPRAHSDFGERNE